MKEDPRPLWLTDCSLLFLDEIVLDREFCQLGVNYEVSDAGHEIVWVVRSTSALISRDQVGRKTGLVEASAEGRLVTIRRAFE